MNIEFLDRKKGEFYRQKSYPDKAAFDVSGYAPTPFNFLSPFTFGREIDIPVPGMEGQRAHSVEGVWQGLKIIDGQIDTTLFRRRPRKRSGNIEGHKFGERALGFHEAREEIYVPSYFYFLETYAPEDAIEAILEEQRKGKHVFLYSLENNGDIRNPGALSNAAILAMYLNMRVFNREQRAITEPEGLLFGILGASEEPLEERIKRLLPLLKDKEVGDAFKFHFIDHPLTRRNYEMGLMIQSCCAA